MTNAIDSKTRAKYLRQLAAIEKLAPGLFKNALKRSAKRVNPHGGSKDENRGAWCTGKRTALAVGRFDLDPFSNPRSHIDAAEACTLENGDDGFGDGTPGSYRIGGQLKRATIDTKLFFQPGYAWVSKAFEHYAHTRYCALLRFDPRVMTWFRRIYRASGLVVVLRKCEFDPPPGVKASSNPTIHALYYRNADDVTEAVMRLGYAWRPR